METKIYGNVNAVQLLKNTVAKGAPSHAYLICGDDGLGKKTFARYFAMTLLCMGEEKPCGSCNACKKMIDGIHPDFKLFEGPVAKFSVHVELVRSIRNDCVIKPNESAFKIYMLTNIQNMTDGAFNAFLKTLEEPPKNVIFLLTAPNANMLPETIVSRLTTIELFPLSDSEIVTAIKDRFLDLSEQTAAIIAMSAAGNLGKAIEQTQNTDFKQEQENTLEFCRLLAAKQEYPLLKFFNQFEKDKMAFLGLLTITLSALRGAIHAQIKCTQIDKRTKTDIVLCSAFDTKKLMELVELFEEARRKLATNANYNLLIVYLCAVIKRTII